MGGPAAAGTKLGRYQIVKHLASGGMAEVLLARSGGIEGFTRHVVIKRIRPAQAKDPAFVQMFLNEARLAAQLHHHNIVQVHDIGQEGNEYFFAMEYVHGEDLRRLLTHLARHKQKVPLEHVVTIISAAALALHHAHEQLGPDRKPLNLVHRDVTPANILVGYDGNVKVVDFGIAKAAIKTTEVTVAGALKGKASYMSPEQCTGSSPADRRSDVFALGVTMYELATTRRLFKGENDFLTMSSIVGGKIPPPTSHRPDMPPQLEAIILKALALKPEDRYQTADQMREALDDFAAEARLRTTTTALSAYMKMQFGEKPEPWLVDDNEDMVISMDFDGSASGMAMAPQVAVESMDIPESVPVSAEAPIIRARSKAISHAPPLKAQIPAVVGTKPARTPTRQIPAMSPAVISADKSKGIRRDITPVPATTPARRKTITVQIPAATQAAAAGAQPRAESSSGVPLPGVAPLNDSQATMVSGIPKDVDSAWDPSRPVQMPPREPTSKIVQPSQLAHGTADDAKRLGSSSAQSRASTAAASGAGAPAARASTPAVGTQASAAAAPNNGASGVASSGSGVPARTTPVAGVPKLGAANGGASTGTAGASGAAASSSGSSTMTASSSGATTGSSGAATGSSGVATGSSGAATGSSGAWSPTKLLGVKDKAANDSSGRIPGLKDKPANDSSGRIPGLKDKLANDSSSRTVASDSSSRTLASDSSSRTAAANGSTFATAPYERSDADDDDDSSRTLVSNEPPQHAADAADDASADAPPRAGLPPPKTAALASSSRITANKADGAALISTNIAPQDAGSDAVVESADAGSDAAVVESADAGSDAVVESAGAGATDATAMPRDASGPVARDSAPALPPPPAVQVIPLAALAESEEAAAAAARGEAYVPAARVAPATVAPSMYPSARPYMSKDADTPAAWPSASSAVESPSIVNKLLGSPQKKKIALAAGGALLLVIVLVFALGGSKKSSSSAAPDKKHDTDIVKPDPVEKAAKPEQPEKPDQPDVTRTGSNTTADTPPDTTPTNTAAAGSDTDSDTSAPVKTTRPKTVVKTPAKTVVTKTPVKRVATTTKTPPTKTTPTKTTPTKTTPTKTTQLKTAPTKTTTQTAKTTTTTTAKKTTTTKPAVTTQPAAKKPNWDPNSLFPKKK